MMQLKLGITLGKIVMFEQLKEDIDATLDPLLQRAITKQGAGFKIVLGGDDVDYAMNFQLYLQTKMLNPYYPPEVSAQCTIVNFIVTEQGLEEQLLADVVNKEKAELEQKRQQLVKNQNDFQV